MAHGGMLHHEMNKYSFVHYSVYLHNVSWHIAKVVTSDTSHTVLKTVIKVGNILKDI